MYQREIGVAGGSICADQLAVIQRESPERVTPDHPAAPES
jgi:hypothetical protein